MGDPNQLWNGPNVISRDCSNILGSAVCGDAAAAAAKSLLLCSTLSDPMDCSLPGFSVHGILQARTLEWVAISFSNAWKWKVKVKSLSRVWLLASPWTAAYQAPPSMGFSRQRYWSGVPLPSPMWGWGTVTFCPEIYCCISETAGSLHGGVWTACLCSPPLPPDCHVEVLTPNEMILGGLAFGR